MLIQNISFLTWDILLSVFLLVSVFLYLMISGRKAALLLVLSAYLGYAVAIAFPDILDKYPYSQYFRPAVFIGALLVSVKILHKFIVLKRGELTFVPAILFSLLASGMFLSIFFSLIILSGVNLNPIIATALIDPIARFIWLVLPLILVAIFFKK